MSEEFKTPKLPGIVPKFVQIATCVSDNRR